ncbi:conserved hypothetical protein [delta proteobacterium NaphS2]|nr:conserved hypothetical protein [delta proteobacterium NaphS2]
MKTLPYKKDERGIALVISLMFVALLGMLGTAAVVITTTDIKIGNNYEASAEAFSDAAAGIEYGKAMIEAGLKADPQTFTLPTAIGDHTNPTDANSASLSSFSNPSGYGFVLEDPGLTLIYDNPNTYMYTSTGNGPNNSTSTITVTAKFKPVIDFAVFGDKQVDVGNTAGIYSYSSSSGTAPSSGTSTHEGDAGSNEEMILRNSCNVDGDVALGDDGAGTEGILRDYGGTVYGEKGEDINRVDPDPLGVVGGEYASKFTTLPGSNDNSSAIDPDGSIGSGPTIDVKGGDTLTLKGKPGGAEYYFTDVLVRNNGILYIDTTTGPVHIYVTGSFRADTGSQVINTIDNSCTDPSDPAGTAPSCGCCDTASPPNFTCTMGAPSDFAIFANSQSSTDEIIIGNSVDFSGFIYAPYIDIEMKNSADIYGALIGQRVEIVNSVEIYFDTDMKDDYITKDLVLTTWRDVKTP